MLRSGHIKAELSQLVRDNRGLPMHSSISGLAATAASRANDSDQAGSALSALGQLEGGLGIGAREGDVFGHGRLELRLELRQQIGMGLSIDLLAQDLLGTGDGQLRHLLAQGFLGALRGSRGFGFGGFTGCGDDPAPSARASSINCAACFSAPPRNSAADSRALRNSSVAFFSACARSVFALSAAASPSAIFCARSSSAFMMGGHTNFIVNHARMKNTTSCANSVAFRFTVFTP